MRRFMIVREGTTLAEGVVLTSGQAVMHWIDTRATSTWDSVEDIRYVHGERLVYIDA